MIRIPSSPPHIPSLTFSGKRPLWSVMIPVYNNIEFLEEAMKSVLIQQIDKDEMQIEVIDDASTDGDVKALVENTGDGRIKYFRQAANVGSLRNFETCINRATGHLVHLLHADDRVRNGYYLSVGDLFKNYPEAGAAFCRFDYIDEAGKKLFNQPAESLKKGILNNWLFQIAINQRIQYAALTVKREVYERLGAFYGLTYGEDWEMWVRIARHYPVAYTPEILADYRKHTQSISGKKFLDGDYFSDLTIVMRMIQDHLPEKKRKRVLDKSNKFYSHYALKMANQLWHTLHDKKIVLLNIKKGLDLHRDFLSYFKVAKIYCKILLKWK
ncbi:MAG: glycosyltransferase [Ginsengibacter sp.]